MNRRFTKFKTFLSGLSFRSGLIVAAVSISCYILAFAQFLSPLTPAAKTALWAIFYSMAKAAQYTAILILGKSGLQRIKAALRRK